jgi:crotonobetainyl-CoA:carnitine CoA-transferase CaiB-like acyl-CoA transferase
VDLIKRLIPHCDVLMENFKVGGMRKWGLSYDDVKKINEKMIYCSITGFGQDGPRAEEAGYDFMIQGASGLMSITGHKDSEPVKLGVAWCDIMTGMYATTGILSALYNRQMSGKGHHVDISLLDVTTACLANQGSNYLVGGMIPTKMGNAHPNIVPYELVPVKDGSLIIAVGNDKQFKQFCRVGGCEEMAKNPLFATNELRVKNREACLAGLKPILASKTRAEWISLLESEGIPCAPVNNIAEAFADKQVMHRGGRIDLPHPTSTDKTVPIFANPLHFSDNKISSYTHPPLLGEHTSEVLKSVLNLSDNEIQSFRDKNIIN